eukprot:TRINITY_DN4307_c0_g1_i2.p1 TRINITY_DN4307_c0_g1~~TRINITY_DN4307_c0_g1_i2.p1  ORF type:complete len:288 (+),score=37.57 TRINITY_DN4307_c0_g1_i2:71-934(+)
MLFEKQNPVFLAFLASLFTWTTTALGAAGIYCGGSTGFSKKSQQFLFGLSAGIMLAASFFSLLLPALELSRPLSYPAWVPLCTGFCLGVGFIKFVDTMIPENVSETKCWNIIDRLTKNSTQLFSKNNKSIDNYQVSKSIALLVIAVTIHNIPEGLVLGVSFGALGQAPTIENFNNALFLTFALALQNITEGLAIAIPIKKAGANNFRSFFYGQLSGFVEVISALIGSTAVYFVNATLPYALSFAGGAMIYAVVAELLPQSRSDENSIGVLGTMGGFVIMMTLDIAFT